MKQPTLSVFFHNYYGNDREWLNHFSSVLDGPAHIFYNCVSGSYHRRNLSGPTLAAQDTNHRLFVRSSTNKGKDIGGKLVLMDAYLRLGIKSDYILLLHDKKSPYQTHSEQWSAQLQRIVEKNSLSSIFDAFNNPQTGIVAAKNTVRNELHNDQQRTDYVDGPAMQSLRERYGIRNTAFTYVAGTMFWVREEIFTSFFNTHPPLQIRSSLEEGNVTDGKPTVTHSWERLLSWIVTGKGYKIQVI